MRTGEAIRLYLAGDTPEHLRELAAMFADSPEFAVVGMGSLGSLPGLHDTRAGVAVVRVGAARLAMLDGFHPDIPVVLVGAERDAGWHGPVPHLALLSPAATPRQVRAAAAAVAAGLRVFEENGEEEQDFVEALTDREVEVLALLADGLTNGEIARRLGVSRNTVKFHVSSIIAKLGAATRTEAVTLGMRRGLIDL